MEIYNEKEHLLDGHTMMYHNRFDWPVKAQYITWYGCNVYIINDKHITSRHLELALRYIEARTQYIFRYTPVPHVSFTRNYIDAPVGKNLIKEARDNYIAHEFEEEYSTTLVRSKRAVTVRYLTGWDGFDNHSNTHTGWKRTKKRKQWM